jgi:DNA-binding transcriptional regulator GbsR (MarR family)
MNDLFEAFRKLFYRTPKEIEETTKNLEQAQENVNDNKDRNDGVYDPTEPVIEAITGIPQELQNFNWLIGGFAVVIFILLIKE